MNIATIEDSTHHDKIEDLLIEERECHVLTFSERAIDLGQSVNYIIDGDIVLHVLLQPERGIVIINNCADGQWQEQSHIPLHDVVDGHQRVAILFRANEVIIALLGSNDPRIVTRRALLTGETARISRGGLIGLQVIEAPAHIPGLTGVIDFCGIFPGGAAVICGWTAQAWQDATETTAVLTSYGERYRVPTSVLWYRRPDLGDLGVGFILSFRRPEAIELGLSDLAQVELETDHWQHVLRAHADTLLQDAWQAREWMSGVLPLIRKGNVAALREIVSRPVFNGHETLSELSLPCHFETDALYLVPGLGLMMMGWMLDPMDSIRSIQICSGRNVMTGDLRARMLRVPRPDVRDAFASQYDLPDARVGYVAFSPVAIKPGEPLYAQIELQSGEIGFKPLGTAVPAGVPAMRRLLQDLRLSGDELQTAFDTVLGAPLVAINSARLARPMAVEEITYGTPPEMPRCSIVVPLYGRLDFVEYQCALFSRGGLEGDELIYVLDQPERKAELLDLADLCHAKFGVPIRLILPAENRGFGPASNLGLAHARGTYVCFLNSDIFPDQSSWMDGLVETLESDPTIGVAGALCLFADGSVQHAGMDYRRLPRLGNWKFPEHPGKGMRPAANPPRHRDMPGVTGACMVMSRALANELGGFDPVYVIGDFEDADLCNRIIARGLRCVLDNAVVLHHLERQSQGDQSTNWRMNLTLLNAWTFNTRWAGGAQGGAVTRA